MLIYSAELPSPGFVPPPELVSIPNITNDTINGVLFRPNNANAAPINATWAQTGRLNPSGNSLDRFEARHGDIASIDAGTHKERSEMGQIALFNPSATIWAAYSIYLFQSAVDGNCTIMQLHPTQGAGDTTEGTNMAMSYFNGTLRFTTATSTEVPLTTPPTNSTRLNTTIPIGQWNNIVHQIKLDPTGASSLWNVWLNGVQILNFTGATGFANSPGNFWKFGIYRNESVVNSVVWFCNMEVGTADLTARIATPLDLPTNVLY